MTVLEDIERIEREELDRQIDRNCRLLELARHNGFELEIVQTHWGAPMWIVPALLVPIVGYMGAVIR